MAENIALNISFGDETLTLAHITVQEMVNVKKWTSFRNRAEWFDGIRTEDPEALIAAYMIAKQRKGETVRFNDTDFDLDDLDATFVDGTGREVEPVIEKNKDGSVKTDKDGTPIPVLDKAGAAQWVYTDSGDPVPPTS